MRGGRISKMWFRRPGVSSASVRPGTTVSGGAGGFGSTGGEGRGGGGGGRVMRGHRGRERGGVT